MRISDWSSDVCSSDLDLLTAVAKDAERLGVLGHRRQLVEQAGRRRAAVAGAEVEVRQAALEEARQHAADRMGIPQQREAVARLDGAQRRRDLVVVGPPVENGRANV